MNPRALVFYAAVFAVVLVAMYYALNPPRPSPPPVVVRPINVTPATQTPAPPQAPAPLCDKTLVKIGDKLTVCGAIQWDGRAVLIQQGWVQGQFSASGLEVCKLSIRLNTLYLNCTAPVLVWPS